MLRPILALSLMSVGCFAIAQGPNAIPAAVFGPQAVQEPAGSPVPVDFQFGLVPLVHGPYSLIVLNPDKASGTISLNGTLVSQFRSRDTLVIQAVTLGAADTLSVELNHGTGATIWVSVAGWEYAFANEYPSAGLSITPFAFPSGSLNWVAKGVVTPVKNQGARCPASWAFSATGAIEGFSAILHAELTSISEQEVIDCSAALSCSIGSVPQAMNWMAMNGDATEAAYPYTGRGKSECKATSTTPSPFTEFPAVRRGVIGSENSLGAMVDEAPVSAVINGNWFASYKGGVASPDCEGQIPSFYGVLVVGYGEDTSTGTPYWLVKTSLGAAWGEQGYFRIARGQNLCGIADYTLLPQN